MLGDLHVFLSEQLKLNLPGKEVQYQMASSRRIKEIPNLNEIKDYKESAVCILLYQQENTIYFPLIERVVYKGVHSGQIALPGGKKDETDSDLIQTALRELEEEIGVSQTHIEVVGRLTQVYIPPSNFLVNPIIAITHQVPEFILSPTEVQSVIPFSLSELLDDTLIKETHIELEKGLKIKTPYFDVRGKVLWGATAMILNELKHILKSSSSFSQSQ